MRVPGGGAPLAWVWGIRGWPLSQPRPPVLWGVRPGPTTHWLWMQGLWALGPVTNPTARALASWLCALWEGMRVPGGGRLLPGCGASGVVCFSTPDRLSFRARGRGPLPTGCGCGGCGRRDPSPTPQRALLRAGFARCAGGSRAPTGGTSCLCVGRPGSGALPRPTARPLRRAAGAHYPLAVGAGDAGLGTCHKPHRALLRAGSARCGGGTRAPGGDASCLGVGRLGSGALRGPIPHFWGVRPGLATHWLCVQCAGAGARLSSAPSSVPWFFVSCARFPGLQHPVPVVAWHLSWCRGCGRRRASLACLVAPRWCAAPRPVRSLSVLRSAFPSMWCLPPIRGLSPPALLGGCAGHVQACREPDSLCLPLALAEAGALGSLRIVPIWGPAMGMSLAGPSSFSRGLCALLWFDVCGPGHCRVRFPVPSVLRRGARPVRRGCFVWTPTPPPLGRRTPRPGPARVWMRALLGRVGRAGLPGTLWCASPFLWLFCPSSLFGPLRAGVAHASGVFVLFGLVCFSPVFPPLLWRPRCLRLFVLPGPGCPGPWRSAFAPTPPLPLFCFLCFGFFSLVLLWRPALSARLCPLAPLFFFLLPSPPLPFFCVFFFFLVCSPSCTLPAVLCVAAFDAPGLGTLLCPLPIFLFPLGFFIPFVLPFFVLPPRLSCLRFSVVSGPGCLGPRCSASAQPSRRVSLSISFFLVFFSYCCFALPLFPDSGCSWCSWPLLRLAGFLFPSSCVAVCVVCALRAGAAVCVVSCWCCPVASFALPGAVCRCLWLLGVRCWVWLPAVVCRWRALAPVVLPGHVARRPAACFSSLWRPAPLCCVLCFVALCCRVVPCCGALLSVFALFCGRCGAVLLLDTVCGALCCSLSCCVLCPCRAALCRAPPPFGRCLVPGFAARVCWWVWLPLFAFWWRVWALVSLSGLRPPALLSGVLVRCPAMSYALCCVPWCRAALWCCGVWPCCAFVRAAGFFSPFCPLFVCKNPLLVLHSLENLRKTKKSKCFPLEN